MEDVRRLPGPEENEGRVSLDELAREGARRMIAAALEAEVAAYVDAFLEEVDEDGHRLVVRNGRARERGLTVGSGTVAIRAPRVNDRRVDAETGERERFGSKSCRPTPGARRRSPRCCRCSTARALHRRLRARAQGPARRGRRRAVAGVDLTAHEGVAVRARPVPHAQPEVPPLRLPVRRRGARLGAPGRGRPAVPARRDWRPRGRRQGATGRR